VCLQSATGECRDESAQDHPLNSATPACLSILLLTVLVSLLGLYKFPKLIEASLFRPYYLLRERRYYTLVSSGFVHANAAHLLFNMLTFYFFGPALERVIGTGRFAFLYIVALIASKARTYLQQRNNPQYASLGASGAVSAVLFAAIVYFPNQSLYILPIPIPIPAPVFAVGYLAYSWYLARGEPDGINHSAHIDGAATGLLFVAAIDPQAYRHLLHIIGV
jgi:membrane associated rhomboid family serine protease